MIILRNKSFSSILPPRFKPTASLNYSQFKGKGGNPGTAIQIEQMRTQRQIMQTQRQKQMLQTKERIDRSKQLSQLQKMEQKKNIEENKQLVNLKRINENNQLNPATRNWGIVKTTSKIVPPVSMKS